MLKRTCAVAALAVASSLSACDPVTYGEIVIESETPFAAGCMIGAREFVPGSEGIEMIETASVAPARRVEVRKRSDMISILWEESAPTRLTLSFKWLGRSAVEEERGNFKLLEISREALLRSCTAGDTHVSVRRSCSARFCEQWLEENERRS